MRKTIKSNSYLMAVSLLSIYFTSIVNAMDDEQIDQHINITFSSREQLHKDKSSLSFVINDWIKKIESTSNYEDEKKLKTELNKIFNFDNEDNDQHDENDRIKIL